MPVDKTVGGFLGWAALTSSFGLYPGRGSRVPSRHGGTLKNRRATSPLVRLVVARDERCEANSLLQGVQPQNWGGTELNRTVTCMLLKATANDRRTSSALP
ncbi:hypothetical protein TNCV_2642911 [Trichonephila clavipes]|nr:hypothetical protein TNCV_2642911 [Trichonephila clavipes]